MTLLCWIGSIKPEGLVATAIGGATLYIAWKQKEIAKGKVNSDLFDRRYKVYEAHVKAIIKIVHQQVDTEEDEDSLYDDMIYFGEQARFLFNAEVYAHLVEVRKNINQYVSCRRSLVVEGTRTADARIFERMTIKEKMEKLGELLIEEQSSIIPNSLEPYLRVKDFRRIRKESSRRS
ncbi:MULTISPECIES: hypothetical protein [Asaia]|uniref:hypothetical protein n=1 Tax=Asaia TaxID=91914 RepID=UPI002FC3B3D9